MALECVWFICSSTFPMQSDFIANCDREDCYGSQCVPLRLALIIGLTALLAAQKASVDRQHLDSRNRHGLRSPRTSLTRRPLCLVCGTRISWLAMIVPGPSLAIRVGSCLHKQFSFHSMNQAVYSVATTGVRIIANIYQVSSTWTRRIIGLNLFTYVTWKSVVHKKSVVKKKSVNKLIVRLDFPV